MTHLRSAILAVISLVFLTGCSGISGALLGSLAGAGATIGGQSLLNRAQEDVEAKIIWRAERRKIVSVVISGLTGQAAKQLLAGDTRGWMVTMLSLLQFHDTQKPETLIKELKKRIKESGDGDTAADAGKS